MWVESINPQDTESPWDWTYCLFFFSNYLTYTTSKGFRLCYPQVPAQVLNIKGPWGAPTCHWRLDRHMVHLHKVWKPLRTPPIPRVSLSCFPGCCCVVLSHWVVSDSVTPWTLARQAPLSMGILQARLLGWVAMPCSRGSSWPRVQT